MPDIVKDVLGWLRSHLARPVAGAISESVLLLTFAAVIIKTFEEYEWRDVFLSSYFLTVAIFALLYVLRRVIHYRHIIRKSQRYVLYTVLPALIVACGFLGWKAWAYAYNPIGIYEQRHWHAEGKNRTEWYLNIRGNSTAPLDVRVRIDACSEAEIDKFYPKLLTSVSPNAFEIIPQDPHHREWEINALQRPAELQFFLSLKKPIENPDKCITHTIRLGETSHES